MDKIEEFSDVLFESETYEPYMMEFVGIIDLKNNHIDDVMDWINNNFHPIKYGRTRGGTSNTKSIEPGIFAVWFATKRINQDIKVPVLMTNRNIEYWLKKSEKLLIKKRSEI
jgi:hypothetical protein